MEKTKKYYENVDIIRGFAILLMVLGHALAKENILREDVVWCNIAYDFIYSFHMPLFFIISGFCYVHPKNYGTFCLRKCRFLLLPYLVFNVITMVMQRLLPFFTLVDNDFGEEIRQVLFYGGSIWFVYVLFEVMLVFPLLAKIADGKIGKAAVLLVLSMALYLFRGKNIGFLCMSQLTYYLPFFFVGYMLRILKEETAFFGKLEKTGVKLLLGTGVLLTDMGLLVVWNRLQVNSFTGYMLKVLVALAGSAAAYLFITAIPFGKVRELLKQFGQYSLQIYLFNGYFIAVSRTVVFQILGISDTIVLVAANFAVGMVCNYIWCYVILKINLFKFLCGKR